MRLDRSLSRLLPLAVGVVSLGITGWLWRHEQLTTQRALKAEFDFSVRQTASRIEGRVASYEQMLRGVQGLLRTAPRLGRGEFEGYVDALLAGADFAGIQFFAYAPLRPPEPGLAAVAPVAYVAPAIGPNLELIGDDPGADPMRRAAMEQAGDSSGPAITSRLSVLAASDTDTQPGFLMFLPVYAAGRAVDSVAERRAAIAGWVLAGVRSHDLMSSLYGEGRQGIDVRIHDGVEVSPLTLMYSSGAARVASDPPRFEALEYIGIAGHTWTLAVSAGPEFELRYGGDAAPIILGSGLGFSLLLALLTRQLVSGRQRAREAALAMTAELRASEERYRRIVETADEGIWMTDARSRTTFVNPKLLQLLGRSGDELLGHVWTEFLDDARVPETAAPGGGAAGPELRFRHKDGSPLWASVSTTIILDAAGRRAGTLAMVTDITARKQADAARADLEAQLRESQKMEAIGTLAGGIAHDFNNILAAILGNIALARDRAAGDAVLAAHLDQIGGAATRARSLVQQILAFSRRQPHHLASLALRPVIDESVRLLRPLLPALAGLELELADTALVVRADATQLQQVVMNLCTNAWHALGGRPGTIRIGLDAVTLGAEAARRLGIGAGGHAHLWVSDDGCGMAEATRARVFEPFFTTKAVGQGTGLGLAVVHGIVATHGGAITVLSAPGQGSRFDLYIPLLDQPAAVPAPAPVAGAPATSVDRRVIYIDDDPVMVMMVQALLERAGCKLTCFDEPRQALAAFSAAPDAFDLVVTDFNMPGLSGLDVAAAMLRLRPGLPVVVSSGFVSDELLAAAKLAGVREVMQKEYTLEQLPGIVQRLLQGDARTTGVAECGAATP